MDNETNKIKDYVVGFASFAIMLAEKPDDSPVYSKKGLFRDAEEGLQKRDTEDEGDV